MNTDFIPAWDQGVLKPLEKLDVHKRGLRHKAVSVFLISNDSVLLQKRASTKYHTPGLWANTCCTHPSWLEDPIDCAHRRLKEELGVDVSELVYKNKIDYKADVGNGLIENLTTQFSSFGANPAYAFWRRRPGHNCFSVPAPRGQVVSSFKNGGV